MLLCAIDQIEPGMTLGASVPHPHRPESELLRIGVKLDINMLDRLRQFQVSHCWVDCAVTGDIDASLGDDASRARAVVCQKLKDDFNKKAASTVSTASIDGVRESMAALTDALLSGLQYARLTERLFDTSDDLFAHSSNVAYLSIVIALSLEDYLIAERKRLAAHQARDTVSLGLAGVFHDIGKAMIHGDLRQRHAVHHRDEKHPAEYLAHTVASFKMLNDPSFPATARQAVLNHHQRFDGTGWPNLQKLSKTPIKPQVGKNIHVFSRIVAAANVLDNLLIDADGLKRPTIAALREFASDRYDGWFDPVIRDAAIRHIPAFPIGALVELNDGSQAAVVAPNIDQPCRPTLRPLDLERPGQLIELAEHEELRIVRCAGEDVEDHLFTLPTAEAGDDATEPEDTAVSESTV